MPATTEELWFSLIATAIGSGLAVKLFEAFMDWRKGRVSKIAALEAALDKAQQAIREHERAQRASTVAHQQEVDELNDQIRGIQIEAHRMRVKLISLGSDPDIQD